jgi:uncharacterized protein (DUF1684 family)
VRIRNLSHVWLLAVLGLAADEHVDQAYREKIRQWRVDYEAKLKRDNGWLTLSGLYWLKEGDNRFGTGSNNEIVLPEGSAPADVGHFVFHDGKIQLRVNPGLALGVNSAPVSGEILLQPDSKGKPDRITLGRLSMIVIHRGSRYAVRLWDNTSTARRDFQGSRWFPVKESYRITAKFISYAEPKMIPILNILGDTEPSPSPGYAEFEMDSHLCHLEPLLEGDHLFFIFKDATSGRQTYPAGRFLYTALPKDGKVILDFNQAENPPCAFTAYATCPLPPRQNHMRVPVEAGELNHEHAAR